MGMITNYLIKAEKIGLDISNIQSLFESFDDIFTKKIKEFIKLEIELNKEYNLIVLTSLVKDLKHIKQYLISTISKKLSIPFLKCPELTFFTFPIQQEKRIQLITTFNELKVLLIVYEIYCLNNKYLNKNECNIGDFDFEYTHQILYEILKYNIYNIVDAIYKITKKR